MSKRDWPVCKRTAMEKKLYEALQSMVRMSIASGTDDRIAHRIATNALAEYEGMTNDN
jgi:hypothetical protein